MEKSSALAKKVMISQSTAFSSAAQQPCYFMRMALSTISKCLGFESKAQSDSCSCSSEKTDDLAKVTSFPEAPSSVEKPTDSPTAAPSDPPSTTDGQTVDPPSTATGQAADPPSTSGALGASAVATRALRAVPPPSRSTGSGGQIN